MAVSVTHTFVSPVADNSDPNEVGPDEWNAAHSISGLGTAAEADTGDFATAAQGALADTATQPGDLATVATTGAYSDLSGVPSLATVATTGDYDDLTNKPTLGSLAALNDLSTFDTGDLGEGSNLYFTDERAQDAVGTILVDSSEIDFTYDDGTPSITAVLKAGSIDESKLDTSVNASLDLADSAVQPAAIANMLETTDIGSSVQAWDAQLDSLSSASANGVSLVTAANYAAMRGLLDLEAGTDFLSVSAIAAAYQPLDSDLTTIAGLSRTRGDLIRGGASAWERYALGTSGYALKSDGTDAVWAASREVLTANRTYYVRTDGSDSNTGLVDSSGGAFLTIGKAIDTVAALDLSIYDVTIQLANATWNEAVTVSAPWIGAGTVTLQGDTSTPSNVTVNASTAITVENAGSSLTIAGLTITSSSVGVTAANGGLITIGTGIVFGACTNYHIRTNGPGSTVWAQNASYSITGAATRHYGATPGGYINAFNATVTMSGTLNFSSAFAFADRQAFINAGSASFTGGTITGKRYSASLLALIYVAGGGASFFPGDSAGTTATGAQYA